jgi:hypothetical protein
MQILILGDKDSKQDKRQEHWVLEGFGNLPLGSADQKQFQIQPPICHIPNTNYFQQFLTSREICQQIEDQGCIVHIIPQGHRACWLTIHPVLGRLVMKCCPVQLLVWMLQDIIILDICRGKHIEEICIRKCV